jgi:hypothetical protein
MSIWQRGATRSARCGLQRGGYKADLSVDGPGPSPISQDSALVATATPVTKSGTSLRRISQCHNRILFCCGPDEHVSALP